MTIKYKARCGKVQYKPSLDWLTSNIESDNQVGFCLACSNEQDGCEPDMRKGICDACDAPKVYGCEELLIMNLCHWQGTPDNRTSHDYGDISARE